MNSIIMSGVIIGNNVIIGCGTVATKNIPDNQIWGREPTHYIKDIEIYYKDHEFEFDFTKNLNAKDEGKYLLEKF